MKNVNDCKNCIFCANRITGSLTSRPYLCLYHNIKDKNNLLMYWYEVKQDATHCKYYEETLSAKIKRNIKKTWKQ